MGILLLGVLRSLEVSIAGFSLLGVLSIPLFLSSRYCEINGIFNLDFSGQVLVVLRICIRFLMLMGRLAGSRFSAFIRLIICIGVLLVGALSVRAAFKFQPKQIVSPVTKVKLP
jgi:esterase/lipase